MSAVVALDSERGGEVKRDLVPSAGILLNEPQVGFFFDFSRATSVILRILVVG